MGFGAAEYSSPWPRARLPTPRRRCSRTLARRISESLVQIERVGFAVKGRSVYLVVLLVTLLVGACIPPDQGQATHLGQRTKTSGCQAKGGLPDSACTPGAIFSTATRAQICESGYAKNVRDVPESEKTQVYDEYE